MTDPVFIVRTGQAGAILKGTPGNLLAFDGTGEGLEGVPPPVVPPPTSAPAVVLTSNLVPAWAGFATALSVDDTYTPLSQFIDGANERNPFLVAEVTGTMGGGNGADAALFANGGTPQELYIQCALAVEVTFSSGVGQCIFTANLFDDLGTQLTFDGGIFTGPTSQLVKRSLIAPAAALGANRSLVLQFKKNDQSATVISGVKLLGCSTSVALVTP